MELNLAKWIRISLINLLLVSIAGVILRYKILFSLPFINQKYLLHGHSHFAFAGWVSQTLMVLMINYLSTQNKLINLRPYKHILIINLITAYGMLITFPIQGYALFSILFSTLSVFVFYTFSIKFWKDLNNLHQKTILHYWFKAAIILGVISSIGTFGLAYMMANKIMHQNWYLAAVYFYLHFQYNGWFLFACIGLFYSLFPTEVLVNRKVNKGIFYLFSASVVPAYFLSVLWINLPLWMYIIVVIASILQLVALIKLIQFIKYNRAIYSTRIGRFILSLSTFALCIKLLLQLGSTVPSLSQLAFGFRPIVIAYLHLVLLGVITLFLIGYIFSNKNMALQKPILIGILVFAGGIFFNELILMLQGIASFSYNSIPYTNELLLCAALIMFTGILTMVLYFPKSQNNKIDKQ